MRKLSEEEKRMIRELYPDHTGTKIAEIIGVSKESVNYYARCNELKHTDEFQRQIKERRTAALIAGRTPESYAKAAAKMRRKKLADTTRKLSGLPQLTKLPIRLLPERVRRKMTRLVHTFNYFRFGDPDDAILYYDSETKRSARAEEYAIKTYGIKFLPADDEDM